ncbi:MAG: homoserine dehydrogenase [Chloroflexota bacterium]
MPSRQEPLRVIQLGFGNVGRSLVAQMLPAQSRFPWLLPCGIADSSGLWVAPGGFSPDDCVAALHHRAGGQQLLRWRPASKGAVLLPAREAYSPALVDRLEVLGLERTVVVDLTSSQELYPLHLALREAGHHIVLANKWPLTVPYGQFVKLWQAGDGTNQLRHETTVGAALPVIGPLEERVAVGDSVEEIVASVSGTLGFVTSSIMDGIPFSQALQEAASRGYTEPDPRVDLGGIDAQRKALILARKLGMRLDLADVQVDSLLPPGLRDVSLEQFWSDLPGVDDFFAEKVADARRQDKVLRYLAIIKPNEKPWVGLTPVPADSVLASTRGTESLFMFRTTLYNEQPLVVRGQGAGGALTASGVLADIVAVGGREK